MGDGNSAGFGFCQTVANCSKSQNSTPGRTIQVPAHGKSPQPASEIQVTIGPKEPDRSQRLGKCGRCCVWRRNVKHEHEGTIYIYIILYYIYYIYIIYILYILYIYILYIYIRPELRGYLLLLNHTIPKAKRQLFQKELTGTSLQRYARTCPLGPQSKRCKKLAPPTLDPLSPALAGAGMGATAFPACTYTASTT